MSTERYSQNKFIMLCGLPGAGKTTLAKSLLDENTVWLSSDKIREELYGAEEVQGEASIVFGEMKKSTIHALKDGRNVIYDACNINSKRRTALLNELKKLNCIKQCIICATPYTKCIERNMLRTRVVREHIVKAMYLSWNPPYYYEGWDEIDIHYSDGARKSLGKIPDFISKYVNYNQDTPYHMESLGKHMQDVGDYLIATFGYEPNSNVVLAGYIHDCGKPFTKGFRDSKGNPCEFAHYYQHQCVGAYDSLFFDFEDKSDADILEIACLVGLHMDPFSWQKGRTLEKYKKRWGEELFGKVMRIHEADVECSIQVKDK